MFKRIFLAGIFGGLVVFVWGGISHMVLPIGMMGVKVPPDAAQQQALSALSAQFDEAGVYVLPLAQKAIWEDDAAMKAFGARSAQQPYAFVAYQPQGRDGMAYFGRNLIQQAIIAIVAGLLAAWIVSYTVTGFIQRTFIVTAMGIFGALIVNASYWNWYRFPDEFTLGAIVDQGIGWFLGGLVIATLMSGLERRRRGLI